MVGEEDGEEFVTDVVQDIVQATLDVIYEKYIQQQTLPYTVDAARELILQIVEVFIWKGSIIRLICTSLL